MPNSITLLLTKGHGVLKHMGHIVEIYQGGSWECNAEGQGWKDLQEELPVCEHCGSILAHPCDCQLYGDDEQ